MSKPRSSTSSSGRRYGDGVENPVKFVGLAARSEEASERLPDQLLAKLADEILGSSELLWEMCGETVREAERIEAKGSEAQPLVGSQ